MAKFVTNKRCIKEDEIYPLLCFYYCITHHILWWYAGERVLFAGSV